MTGPTSSTYQASRIPSTLVAQLNKRENHVVSDNQKLREIYGADQNDRRSGVFDLAQDETSLPKPHTWAIPEREYLRQESHRGRRHAYETLNPTRTALVVIDMVPFFVHDNPSCKAIVPNINTVSSLV